MNLELDTEQLKLLHDIVLEYRDSLYGKYTDIDIILKLIKEALE